MLLEEFYDYKNQLIGELIQNEKIIEMLRDTSEGAPYLQPEEFIYKHIFPFEFVPDTLDHGISFICCDVDIQKGTKTFYKPIIYVWVITHKSLLRLPEGGVRIDELSSEVAKIMCGSRMYTMGELELQSVKRFAPIADYQGRALTFTGKEFSFVRPTGKVIPSNRKNG